MTDLRSWLILLRAPGLNSTIVDQLLETYGDAATVIASGRSGLRQAGLQEKTISALLHPDNALVDADLAWLAKPGRELIPRGADNYPVLLAATPGAPLALFVDGDPLTLALPQLAIVGSRNPTATGRDNATAFARHLAGCGLAITSGLATGIDSCAHAGALDGTGRTIAVCGTGLDQVYPADRAGLADRIRQNGALVSEFPPGTPPRRAHFPQRNRIIAGMAMGTLVVEAAHRSGSLITAHRAIEFGREVFAIPGSIHNPLSRGCHRLIREGAKLVESSTDILDELAPVFQAAHEIEPAQNAVADHDRLDEDYAKLLDCIGYEPTQIDTMVQRSGLTANEVSSMLLILELRGYVSQVAGGGFSRTGKKRSTE
ncbi:MAG: DNA-processing protein DprA [Gammaproteobacteria bacterium]|nr:DNA-processing protein DprA [Gammaproteobacteria bacterium]NNM20601.1 DNA-protecting protein DprA [Gammaproteobacteria bacterium]